MTIKEFYVELKKHFAAIIMTMDNQTDSIRYQIMLADWMEKFCDDSLKWNTRKCEKYRISEEFPFGGSGKSNIRNYVFSYGYTSFLEELRKFRGRICEITAYTVGNSDTDYFGILVSCDGKELYMTHPRKANPHISIRDKSNTFYYELYRYKFKCKNNTGLAVDEFQIVEKS